MCTLFEVSRSGYYDFANRVGRPGRDVALVKEIAECQRICRKTYGYRRVEIWLDRQGVYRNPKTVLRIMNKYGLISEIRRRKKYKKMRQQLHKYGNLLNRQFNADKPNQKWITDISYINTAGGILHLPMIRDLYDNSVMAYKTGTEQTVNLVLNTIKAAKENEAIATETQFHSDQVFRYTSQGYFNLTKEYDITPPPSMSRHGNCYYNIMAENFFSIFRTKFIYRQKIQTFDEARQLICDYIWFYNNQRIQFKTKLTPLEKRCQFQTFA